METPYKVQMIDVRLVGLINTTLSKIHEPTAVHQVWGQDSEIAGVHSKTQTLYDQQVISSLGQVMHTTIVLKYVFTSAFALIKKLDK